MSKKLLGKLDKKYTGRVDVHVEDGVGWLKLNNPRKHNAISLSMWETIQVALPAFSSDPTIRCIVISGEGERAFCAGADVSEKLESTPDSKDADARVALPTLQALRDIKKPTLAMISGHCIGAGVAIALACDLRIASDSASFGIPAAKLGLAYYYSLIKRLTDVVGPSNAKQMIYTADRYSAVKALQMGLVNEVILLSELPAFVTAMAVQIALNAPLTIGAAKQAIGVAVSDSLDHDIAACDASASICLASEDYAEGLRAFAEKRPPVFVGR